jgi:hypothetical protein
MSKSIAILPVILAALPLSIWAAGEAAADTRTYSLSGFDRVSVSAGIDVDLKQGPFSVVADEPNGKFDNLVLEVRGNTLHISRKSNIGTWFSRGPDIHVAVSAPNYVGIGASSGSAVEGSNLSLKDLEVEVSSGADVDLAGSCTSLRVDISSGADFDGEQLRCETASVDASSGADADAYATRSATGDASSGADVTFHGKPAEFDKDTSSGGSVKSL